MLSLLVHVRSHSPSASHLRHRETEEQERNTHVKQLQLCDHHQPTLPQHASTSFDQLTVVGGVDVDVADVYDVCGGKWAAVRGVADVDTTQQKSTEGLEAVAVAKSRASSTRWDSNARRVIARCGAGGRSKKRVLRTLHLFKSSSPPTHRTTLKRMAWGMIYLCGLFVIRVDEVMSEGNGINERIEGKWGHRRERIRRNGTGRRRQT
jgi:hypothetical protein